MNKQDATKVLANLQELEETLWLIESELETAQSRGHQSLGEALYREKLDTEALIRSLKDQLGWH